MLSTGPQMWVGGPLRGFILREGFLLLISDLLSRRESASNANFSSFLDVDEDEDS